MHRLLHLRIYAAPTTNAIIACQKRIDNFMSENKNASVDQDLINELRRQEAERLMEEAERAEQERIFKEHELQEAEIRAKIARRRSSILRTFVLYISILIAGAFIYLGVTGYKIDYLLSDKLYLVIGVLVGLSGFLGYFYSNTKFEMDFIDVDERRRIQRAQTPQAAWPFPVSTRPMSENERHLEIEDDNIDEEDQNSVTQRSRISEKLEGSDPFVIHFMEVCRILTERASDADEKASLLLSKGTTYTKWGIAFFIVSIIGWQILCATRGFHNEYIYGIVSCTGLFIFIEFLSAWFLKQYRQYVDTATYLLKVKATFDRYLGIYFAYRNFFDDAEMKAALSLIKVLEKKMEWPDSYLMKKEAANFAAEATGAISSLAKELRRKRKNRTKKEKAKPAE